MDLLGEGKYNLMRCHSGKDENPSDFIVMLNWFQHPIG